MSWKKWVLIYLVIGAVLYAVFYSLFLAKKGTNTYSTNYPTATSSSTATSQVTPTESTGSAETVNWKTFSESKYGFSFKYPETWIKQKDTPLFLIALGPLTHGGGGFNGVRISTLENPQQLSLADLLKQGKLGNVDSNNFPKWEKTTIAGITDSLISRSVPGAGPGEDAFVSKEQTVLDIYCGSCTNEIFDQILSAFKFTDQNLPTSKPSDALDLPKDKCPCWNSTKNICLPITHCM